MKMLPHKRGDSFSRLTEIPVTNEDGSPAFADGYFVGWTVRAQVRTAKFDKFLSELECSWVDPLTTRILRVQDFDTKNWELGPAEMDVEFTRVSDNFIQSTATLSFDVIKDVTREIV